AMPSKRLLKVYDEMSPEDFIQSLVGPDYKLITKNLGPVALNRLLHTNYDTVYEIADLLNTKKFTMPKSLWNEDLLPYDEDSMEAIFGQEGHVYVTDEAIEAVHATTTMPQETPVPQATPTWAWQALNVTSPYATPESD